MAPHRDHHTDKSDMRKLNGKPGTHEANERINILAIVEGIKRRPNATAILIIERPDRKNSAVKRTRNTETEGVALQVGRIPIAASRAETLRNIRFGSSADNTKSATTCSPRRAVRWCSIIFVVIAILDPL